MTESSNTATPAIDEQPEQAVAKVERREAEIPLVELELENVTYAPVTTRAGKKALSSPKQKSKAQQERTVILNNVTTTISPFQLTAWIGPSGSGKTSLITVAADLMANSSQDLIGNSSIKINGQEGKIPKRFVGVVWQDDLLLSNLTVRENIYFAARLKTPESVPDSEVDKVVSETMEELGLTRVQHSLVGIAGGLQRGVSGGERKRVSVAVELVVRPSLLLLDEPTSGLDATTAQALVSTLKELASKGHSVAVVIHQPRTTIFNMFDHLLLMSRGNVVYNGPASLARQYLESCPSVPCLPPETGIADWIMDVISQDEARCSGPRKEGALVDTDVGTILPKHWRQHGQAFLQGNQHQSKETAATESLEKRKQRFTRQMSSLQDLNSGPKFNSGFLTQLVLLTRRTLKQQRGDRITVSTISLQFAYVVFCALFWWRLPDNTRYIFERNSLLFFMLIAQSNGIVINSVSLFQKERQLLRRERAKKMYRVASYFLAKTISDMTNNVFLPTLYSMIVYWTANFRPSFTAYIKFILAFYLTVGTAQSMGLFMSVAIPSVQLGLVLAPPVTLFFMIMGGFYIPFENMHPGIKWASWLSFARYGYTAMIVNEFAGRDIPCVDNPDDISVTIGGLDGECPLPGDQVINQLGIYGVAESYWFNVGMTIVLQVVFRIASYIYLRRKK